ncbi:lactoylglutathione lyase [Halobacteriovorax marinus]|uniref:Aldoketomutase n=1 Tax=Halobacteriovorax marinus TaxID=97084 RepID=A0A1Y5F6T6_9BACT|nr:lactoylglutathione lyase [Halobacteriovorax marinus]
MKFLHSMIRVKDLEKSLEFYVGKLGLKEMRRSEYPQGKFTLIYLATGPGESEIELTYNWDQKEKYSNGKNFGHFAFAVDDINDFCAQLLKNDVVILRPPRDGYMAFIKCPDGISIELLQSGGAITPVEPFISMENTGDW